MNTYSIEKLVRLSKEVWGESAADYLAARLESVITFSQLKILIEDLEEKNE
jgi:hypothetical protein